MNKKYALILFTFLCSIMFGYSQCFSDDFSSGLTQWSNTTDWTTSSGELKHNLSGIESESYIYADLGAQDLSTSNFEWDVCVRNGNWDPSGGNRFSYFLLSSTTNLMTSGTGYAVGVNMSNTTDALTLYSVNNNTYTAIISSSFNWNTNEDVCIRVTRTSAGNWELFYSDNGAAEVSGGTTNNTTYTTGNYIGGFFDFTSSRAGLLWFDDIEVDCGTTCTDIVDFANIVSPTTSPQNINEGDTFNVTTQAVEPGITDANSTAAGAGIEAWIGYSSTDNDPSTETGWTWVAATYTTDVGANDQFVAEIGAALAPGTYYYACRYRLNNCSFYYGGTGGAWNNDSVELIVTSTSSCSPIFTDDFSSGLTSWSNTTDWTTTGGELKHNLSSTAGTSYIYSDIGSQNLNAGDYEWEVCIRNDNWDPSGGNNFSYFLLSDNTNIASGNGYAIGVNQSGTADDFLTFYEVTNGSYSELIESTFDWDTDEDVCIRVTRNDSGDWEVFYNPNGSGEVSAGTVTDNTYSTGSYIGAFFEYTSSRAGRLWLDDVSVCSDVVVSGPELQLVAASNDVACGYTLDFGNVESDGSTLDVSIFVDNDGSSALQINSLNISGTNAADFSIISPSTFPVSIAPGNTQEIVIRFTSNNNGARTGTLTIDNNDGSDANDETMCVVNLTGTGVTNSGGGPLMITQYYEGTSLNKWIEIVNVSGASVSAGSYYLAVYNKGGAPNYTERPLNGTPTASVSIPAMAAGAIVRFKEPATVLPAYAVPGETGYDGNPTSNMMVASFSGNDIIIISSTNDAASYTNRIDIIGEYSADGENWGDRRCFIRKECVASNPSISFDINEWIEFTDAEVETPVVGTNPYLGQHFRGVTEYTGSGANNGWDNGLPDRSRIVEIGQDYLTGSTSIGSFESCSLTINSLATLDIQDGNYVSIITDLTVDNNATLEIRNEGQLVMVEDTGIVTNNGNTNVRKTTDVINQYDYVYWSAPIDYDIAPLPPQTIDAVLTNSNPNRIYRFNTANYNDADNDTFDDDQNDWNFYSSEMIKGVGYAAMTASTTSEINNVAFNGKVNNGIVSVNLALSADATGDTDNDEDDWNLVGNPYPSAISADSLISQNTNINGTVYFWARNTAINISNPGPDTFNYSRDDYAMYNFTGGIGTGTAATTGSGAPTGHIASGQGFFVDAITATPLTFNNSMRSISLANNDFFRNSNTTTSNEKDRMWINLTNSDGVFSQILVGFIDDATNGKDRLYDGVRLSGTNYIDFYSLDETAHEYGIQGRSTFDETDIIPLGYNAHILGSLSIELGEREGVLIDTPIYLVDKYLNTTHDLTISPYVFTTEDGKYNDRFEIVFTLDALSDNEFEINANALSIIENNNGSVTFVMNGVHTMESIEIIDLFGRTVYNLNANSSSEKTFNLSRLSQATYIAKVKLDNGYIITKKAIKRK